MTVGKRLAWAIVVCGAFALAACDETTAQGPVQSGGGGPGGGGGSDGGAGGGAVGGASSGGEGGGGMGGGGMGGGAACLDSALFDAQVTVDDPGLCVVDMFTAPFEVGYALVPKWGRHGGPVTMVQAANGADLTDEVTITRWAVPNATNASLTTEENLGPFSLGIGSVAVGPFMSPVVVDLPLFDWTLVGWTGQNAVGEIIAVDGTTVADRWANVGYFDAVAVSDGTRARLLHNGQSQIGDGDANTAATGLYGAEFCAGPMLCASGGEVTIATWGAANGPVAHDGDGNVFAVNTDFVASDQELRGFLASDVAPGAAPAAGTELFTVNGYGSALGVLTVKPSDDGWVLYQPIEGIDAQPVLAQRYRVTVDAVEPVGTPTTALTLAGGAGVSMMNDAAGRVWLGVVTGANVTTFFVIDRAP